MQTGKTKVAKQNKVIKTVSKGEIIHMKTIGVLTSGGDSQGMNAAVYAVVRYALQNDMTVYGIMNGYKGLIAGNVKEMTSKDVDGIVHRAGTILGTSRCPEMKTDEGRQKAAETLKKFGIEGLVVIGGDGSFQGAKVLTTLFGVKTIGIPGTIDNDLAYTSFTLGFDTAVTVVVDTIKMLRDTMSCNDRSCVVEVMGRRCGDIAMYGGLTAGAEVIMIPEMPMTIDEVVEVLKRNEAVGKYDNIIVVAEGVGHAEQVRAEIEARMPEINLRSMVVGHIQRGGDTTFQDRLLGIRMGAHAVKCLLDNKTNRVIGVKNNEIFDEDLLEALAKEKKFDVNTYELSKELARY